MTSQFSNGSALAAAPVGGRAKRSLSAWHRPALRSLAIGWALVLGACAGKPPTPEWQMNAHAASQRAVQAYLVGDTRVEALEWERAREQVARTGRPDWMARLELLRCAAQVASLEATPCERFEALRADAAPEELAYAAYLQGAVVPDQVPLLPQAQRGVASGAAPAPPSIAEPLPRLVAAGVLLRTGRGGDAWTAAAVETASAQGWRRPLLAWLAVELQVAEAAGDQGRADALRRRIALVEQGGRAQWLR